MQKWFEAVAAADGKPARMYLFDEIGGWGITADGFKAAMPDGDFELHINSRGGSVYEGLAVYNLLRGHAGRVTAVVDGLAASMASVILCACPVRRMAPGSMAFVHDPIAEVYGDKDDLEKAAKMLGTVGGSLAAIYMQATGADVATVEAWMKGDTLFTAAEALAAGLATEVDAAMPAAAALDPARLPEPVAKRLADAEAKRRDDEALAKFRPVIEAELAARHAETVAAMKAAHDTALARITADAAAKVEAAQRNEAAMKAALEAATAKLNALAAGGFAAPDGEPQDSAEAFWSLVAQYQGEGKSRNDAIARATRENPAAHKAMIAAANKKPNK